MEGALAAAAYGIETVVEGGLALAKGLSLATAPLKATFKQVRAPAIPRSSHTVSIVKNRAYIFGGEMAPRQPVDTTMHIVTLPATDLTQADYQSVAAAPAQPDGPVPEPRLGHTAAVIDNTIYVFGGRGGPDMAALEEHGRVWAFDTTTRTWAALDPPPDTTVPEARSYHASAATPHPQHHAPRASEPQRTPPPETEDEDDDDDDGLAYGEHPDLPINTAAALSSPARAPAEPAQPNTYGTLLIHAGCLSSGARTADVWAFDIASRTWAQLPPAPSPPRGGASLVLLRDRLYRFGGFDGAAELGGAIDYLDLNTADLIVSGDAGAAAMLAPLAPRPPATWRSSLFAPSATADGSGGNRTAPANRSVCGLVPVSTGQGREYLLLMFGEGVPSGEGHGGAGGLLDDAWSFQLRPEGMSAGALKDATRAYLLGKGTGEADVVEVRYYVPDEASGAAGDAVRMVQEGQARPWGKRAWFGVASCVDAGAGPGSVLVWGGVGADNERLGDAWIVSVDI